MAFATACGRAPDVPSSSGVGTRAVSGSPHRRRPYRSLVGRTAFSNLYREGARRRRGDVVVITAPGMPGPPQVAFVAGRRVGTAVRRNRAKRRLRAALEGVALAADTAYVVVAERDIADVEFERLAEWLSGAIEKGRSEPKEEPA